MFSIKETMYSNRLTVPKEFVAVEGAIQPRQGTNSRFSKALIQKEAFSSVHGYYQRDATHPSLLFKWQAPTTTISVQLHVHTLPAWQTRPLKHLLQVWRQPSALFGRSWCADGRQMRGKISRLDVRFPASSLLLAIILDRSWSVFTPT